MSRFIALMNILSRVAVYICVAGILYQIATTPRASAQQSSIGTALVAQSVNDLTKRVENMELAHLDSEHRLTKLEQLVDDNKYYFGIILTMLVTLVGELAVRWVRAVSKAGA